MNEPLQPANAAKELDVLARVRERLQPVQLGHRRCLVGREETGGYDLLAGPGRVWTGTGLKVVQGSARLGARRLVEIIEALGFAKGLITDGLRTQRISGGGGCC